MFTVKLALTHPTNVAAAYDPTQIPVDLNAQADAFQEYSRANGLVSFEMTMETVTRFVISYVWESEAKRDAFMAHFGQEYTDFFAAWTAYVSSRGCKLSKIEELTQDVL